MKMARALLAAALILSAGACSSRMPKQGLPLQWTPRASVNTSGAGNVFATTIQVDSFSDSREKPESVGANLEHAARSVVTHDSVPRFIGDNLRVLLRAQGFQIVDSGGDAVLSGDVQRFYVTETDTYRGEVVLQLVLRGHDSSVLWQGVMSGQAEHFGRSYSAENYNETFSDALVDAMSNLFQNPDFRRVLLQAHAT